MTKDGPGVKASPTPQRERKEAQRHSLDAENGERLLFTTEIQNRLVITCARRSTKKLSNANREHQSNEGSQGTIRKAVKRQGQNVLLPSQNPMQRVPTMHSRTGPQTITRRIQRSRNQACQGDLGQGPPPLKRSGAWRNRHSVLNFLESKASICCICDEKSACI